LNRTGVRVEFVGVGVRNKRLRPSLLWIGVVLFVKKWEGEAEGSVTLQSQC